MPFRLRPKKYRKTFLITNNFRTMNGWLCASLINKPCHMRFVYPHWWNRKWCDVSRKWFLLFVVSRTKCWFIEKRTKINKLVKKEIGVMWVGLKTTSSTFSVDWNFTRFDSLETAAVVTMTTTAMTGGNELNSILVWDTWAHVIKVSHQNPRMRQKKILIKTHNTLTILWHKLNLQHSVLVHCFQTTPCAREKFCDETMVSNSVEKKW